MTHRFNTQVSALGLTAMLTLVMLASVNVLATQPHEELLAQSNVPAPMQVVVIEGQRSART